MDEATIPNWTCYRCGETKPHTAEFFEPYRRRLRKHCRECPNGLSLDVRFWRKVQKAGPDECWLWAGAQDGYGAIWAAPLKRAMMHTHVVSYILHNGILPDGLWVLHTCDVMLCVNPRHLYAGTSADNGRDMRIRNRRKGIVAVHGERVRNGRPTRFTASDILHIREAVRTGPRGTSAALAKSYGVARTVITDITRGRRWKHTA